MESRRLRQLYLALVRARAGCLRQKDSPSDWVDFSHFNLAMPMFGFGKSNEDGEFYPRREGREGQGERG